MFARTQWRIVACVCLQRERTSRIRCAQQHLSVKSGCNGVHKIPSLTLGEPYRVHACLIPKCPVCSTSVSAPYRPRARYTSLAPARMQEVYLGKVQLLMHEPKHGNATLAVTYSQCDRSSLQSFKNSGGCLRTKLLHRYRVGKVAFTVLLSICYNHA